MQKILDNCLLPYGIKNLSLQEKEKLAAEVRTLIIETVSENGGHLAPSLGTVELTLALLSVFNPSKDSVIWDVGHQAYAWKILTDRKDRFHTLRKHEGISGFPKPSESPYDHFIAGHASVSISAALGKKYARDLSQNSSHVIAVIGDGALTGGMAYEALNHAGYLGKNLIVILNDNNMSIAPNVGALSRFISSNLSNTWVLDIKKSIRDFFYDMPKVGRKILNFLKKGEQSFKSFFTPGSLFEAFDFNYIGPVDGHDIDQLIKHLEKAIYAEKLNQPILLHVKTTKGKGYKPAELRPSFYHAIASFDPETGLVPPAKDRELYSNPTSSFTRALSILSKENEKILTVTAAMLEGTGLHEFNKSYPERCIDVGICEQHAVTFAAGLASEGYTPIVAIYSTFLQRAYDQLIHDVCLQNLHVIFCVDRAGLVGEDGPTHNGAFDLTFLRSIPNMKILVPSHPDDFLDCLATAVYCDGPIALRYPRGNFRIPHSTINDYTLIPLAQGQMLYPDEVKIFKEKEKVEDEKSCIIAIGSCVNTALIASSLYFDKHKKVVPVFNARWVKPLPTEQLNEIATNYQELIIIEENTKVGGFSSAIIEHYTDTKQIQNLSIERIGLPDIFVEHGSSELLRNKYEISAQKILSILNKE